MCWGFDMNLSSDRDFSEIEAEMRYKIGLSEDVDFIGFGVKKILKGEMVFELQIVKLIRTNLKMERHECKLVNIQLNLFIDNTNIRTQMKCFDEWNKRDHINQIGKVIGVKGRIFEICSTSEYEYYRSMLYHGNYGSLR
jgi:hypothetical protein